MTLPPAELPAEGDLPPLRLTPQLLRQIRLEQLLEERGRARQMTKGPADYLDDPVGFIKEYVIFPEIIGADGKPAPGGLTVYQERVLRRLVDARRLGVRGPRRMGKSAVAALTVLWFAITREAAGRPWMILTTAASWLQLEGYFWHEVRNWSMRLDWDKLGREPFASGTELRAHGLHLTRGYADAASPNLPERMEGAHADSILYVFDEAKAIEAKLFDSAAGSFFGGTRHGHREAYALAISTPGSPNGRFYDICRGAMPGWEAERVALAEVTEAGQIDPDEVARMRTAHGESSAYFQTHVLGEFATDEEGAIISLAWADAAVSRWKDWAAAGAEIPEEGPHIVGVDVAGSGLDKTVLAVRHGHVITEIRVSSHEDTMAVAGRVRVLLDADPRLTAVVDYNGLGQGVYDRLKEQGCRVIAFRASARTVIRSDDGMIKYKNDRAAAWWGAREQMDPSRGAQICIPDDPELLAELTAAQVLPYTSSGMLQVEEKKDIKKRIGRSCDRADAVIQALFSSNANWASAYGIIKCPNESCPRGAFYEKDDSGRERTRCPWCGTSLRDDDDGDAGTPASPQPSGPSAYPAAALMGHATRQPGMQQLTQLLGRR